MTWQGQLYATHAHYMKGATDAVTRNSAWLAMCLEKGKITKVSGTSVVWDIEVYRPEVQNLDDLQVRNRVRKNLLAQAQLPWAKYDCMDLLSDEDLAQNDGPEALVRLVDKKQKAVIDALKEQISRDMYVDGALYDLRLHGMETFGAYTSVNSVGVLPPNDEYAGVSTVLQGLGGDPYTTSTAWPDGIPNSPEYDAWSPLIISATHSAHGAGSPTWAANCQEILSKGYFWVGRNKGMIETVFMNSAYMSALSSNLRAIHRLDINVNSKLVKYGQMAPINFMGMDCVMDAFCPAPGAYGVNWEVVEIQHLFPQLFPTVSKDRFFADGSINMGCKTMFQLKFEGIRNLFKVTEP